MVREAAFLPPAIGFPSGPLPLPQSKALSGPLGGPLSGQPKKVIWVLEVTVQDWAWDKEGEERRRYAAAAMEEVVFIFKGSPAGYNYCKIFLQKLYRAKSKSGTDQGSRTPILYILLKLCHLARQMNKGSNRLKRSRLHPMKHNGMRRGGGERIA